MVIWVIKTFLYSSSVYSWTSYSLFLLLGPCLFCPLLCPSLHEMFPWYLQFSWRDFYSFSLYCFPLFLCTVHLRRSSYLPLLFSGTLHSVGYIFPFSLVFHLDRVPEERWIEVHNIVQEAVTKPSQRKRNAWRQSHFWRAFPITEEWKRIVRES